MPCTLAFPEPGWGRIDRILFLFSSAVGKMLKSQGPSVERRLLILLCGSGHLTLSFCDTYETKSIIKGTLLKA